MKCIEEQKFHNVRQEKNLATKVRKCAIKLKNQIKNTRVCGSGICAEAAQTNKIKFICKCKKFRLFKPQCTNRTCVGVIPSPEESTSTTGSCVCKNGPMQLGNYQVCEGGQCQRARASNRADFVCKCLPQVKCDRSTCEKDIKFNDLAQVAHTKNKRKCRLLTDNSLALRLEGVRENLLRKRSDIQKN